MKLFTKEDIKKLSAMTIGDAELIVVEVDDWLEKPDIELLGKLEIMFLEWRGWASFELWLVHLLADFKYWQHHFEEYEYNNDFDL